MAMTKKAVNDHFLHSFGQIDEAVRSRTGNDGLIVGGIMEGTATAVEHGDFAAMHFDANQNLMVNVASGEIIASLGTIGVVESVSNLADGTVGVVSSVSNLAAGTVSAVNNLVTGTVAAVTSVTNLVAGTVSAVNNVVTGTLATLGTVGVLNAGSVVVTAGTIGDLDTVGTVGVVNAGSVVVTLGTTIVNAGTVQVNPKSPTAILMASALGTAGGSAWGTLIPAVGSGTVIYTSGLEMVVHSGTVDCVLSYGTALTGEAVLARGNFAQNGGIIRDFSIPIASTANAELCYELAGAGTVFFAVNYWKA